MSRLVDYNSIVRFDYQAQSESEISLKVGEIVKVVEEFDSGWWVGQTTDGKLGAFPGGYTERIDTAQLSPKGKHSNKSGNAGGSAVANKKTKKILSPRKQRSNNAGVEAIALYDFNGSSENELTFKKGDRIVVTKQLKGGWWRGRRNDGRDDAFFPQSYIHLVANDARSGPFKARALYDFHASTDAELSLRKGDLVEIEAKLVDAGGWWRGRIGDKRGHIPKDYVEILPDDNDDGDDQGGSGGGGDAATAATVSGGDATTNDQTSQQSPKAQQHTPALLASDGTATTVAAGDGAGDANNGESDEPVIRTRVHRSMSTLALEHAPAATPNAPPPASRHSIIIDVNKPKNTTVARAKFAYTGASARELSFEKGVLIQEVSVLEGEWWRGVYRGAVGYFPMTYVELVPNNDDIVAIAAAAAAKTADATSSASNTPAAAEPATAIPKRKRKGSDELGKLGRKSSKSKKSLRKKLLPEKDNGDSKDKTNDTKAKKSKEAALHGGDLAARVGVERRQHKAFRATVVRDHLTTTAGELSLTVGDDVLVVAEGDNGVWRGVCHARDGLFDSAVVKVTAPLVPIDGDDDADAKPEAIVERASGDDDDGDVDAPLPATASPVKRKSGGKAKRKNSDTAKPTTLKRKKKKKKEGKTSSSSKDAKTSSSKDGSTPRKTSKKKVRTLRNNSGVPLSSSSAVPSVKHRPSGALRKSRSEAVTPSHRDNGNDNNDDDDDDDENSATASRSGVLSNVAASPMRSLAKIAAMDDAVAASTSAPASADNSIDEQQQQQPQTNIHNKHKSNHAKPSIDSSVQAPASAPPAAAAPPTVSPPANKRKSKRLSSDSGLLALERDIDAALTSQPETTAVDAAVATVTSDTDDDKKAGTRSGAKRLSSDFGLLELERSLAHDMELAGVRSDASKPTTTSADAAVADTVSADNRDVTVDLAALEADLDVLTQLSPRNSGSFVKRNSAHTKPDGAGNIKSNTDANNSKDLLQDLDSLVRDADTTVLSSNNSRLSTRASDTTKAANKKTTPSDESMDDILAQAERISQRRSQYSRDPTTKTTVTAASADHKSSSDEPSSKPALPPAHKKTQLKPPSVKVKHKHGKSENVEPSKTTADSDGAGGGGGVATSSGKSTQEVDQLREQLRKAQQRELTLTTQLRELRAASRKPETASAPPPASDAPADVAPAASDAKKSQPRPNDKGISLFGSDSALDSDLQVRIVALERDGLGKSLSAEYTRIELAFHALRKKVSQLEQSRADAPLGTLEKIDSNFGVKLKSGRHSLKLERPASKLSSDKK